MSAPRHQVVWQVVDGKACYDGRPLADWVPEIVEDIVRAFDPLQIILFGSLARGGDGPDSDVDLLVVFPHVEPAKKRELMGAIRFAIGAPAPIDVFVTDPEEIARRRDVIGSFHYWPMREGTVIYERPA